MAWPGRASEHEADHGEMDEGRGGSRLTLEVAGEASIAADPGQRSLDDPTFGEDDEAMQLVALDDFDDPASGPRGGLRDAWSLIARLGEHALHEGKETARAPITTGSADSTTFWIGS